MMLIKALFVLVLWGALAGCSSDQPAGSLQAPSGQDRAVASAEQQAYQKHCSVCHAAPDPDAFDGVAWTPIIERMLTYHAARALPPITTTDKALIMNYLIEGQGR